jgi:hypothetical protein
MNKKLLPDVVYFDTEFNRVTHPRVNPVCISALRGKEFYDFWTHNNPRGVKEAREYFEALPPETILFGWQCVAEARFLRSIGVNPLKFKWIDGFLEYRCLTNHNDELAYGEQLVEGKVKMTKRPPNKYERTEEDGKDSFKPTHSLAEATFKLLGKIRDTEHKNQMRDLIISDPEEFDESEQESISGYCRDDVAELPALLGKLIDKYDELDIVFDEDLLKEMLLRGKYSVLTAMMEDIGYPVDVDKMRNFTASVGPILERCQKEINQLFPEIKPFYFNVKERRYSMNQTNVRNWLVKNVDTKKWIKTKKYKELQRKKATIEELSNPKYLSLSLDAFEEKFPYRHEYPEDNFGAQMVRYLKLKQAMNGFLPSKKGSIWDRLGPDGRIRCYLNPYGSQSSRSQPPSTSFLFLKPAWTRSLCYPKKGRVIGSFDYKSEEFLISAILSQSEAMIDSYRSGDVYLAFGKIVGMIPPEGTKQTHKAERDLCKALVLGMSYLMSAKGLAEKLTADTGRVYTVEQAEGYIRDFYDAYWELEQFQNWTRKIYEQDRHIKLGCGWYMFGDNNNFRSVANLPVQGLGASIMRKAVEIAVEEYGLEVIFTLHDAIYIEFDHGDWSAMDKLADAMKRAFVFYFDEDMKEDAEIIQLDGKVWGPDFPEEDGELTTPEGLVIDHSRVFVDERAVSEYEKFHRYFDHRAEVEL